MSATTSAPETGPFLGLKNFDEHTSEFFFGRDEQIDELLAKLNTSRFVTVIGSSGSGKSSLVRSGLIPALRAGYLATAGPDWRVATARPGNNPVGNLALALTDALGAGGLEQTLRRGPLGLVEAVGQARLTAKENVLVIADQFEELFRFQRSAYDREAAAAARGMATAFVKLLLEASAQRELSIFVILTMRSDFLGDCSQFRNLPERINHGLYLIPRMRRDQIEQAVSGPAKVAGARITPRLVERVLNDIGDSQDQLPVLQHALLRTWNRRPEGADLDLEHYNASGGLENALGRHADELYERFRANQQHHVHWMFRRLTEVDDTREIRRPATIDELAAVCGADVGEVQAVVNVFAASGVSFLTQTGNLVDLTHESLIRQWQRLRAWATQELADRKDYERFAEYAALGLEKQDWLRGAQLARAEEWMAKGLNACWAKPYRGDYDSTAEFIRRSTAAYLREQEDKQKARLRAQQRTRLLAVVAVVVALVIAGLAVVLYGQRRRADSATAAAVVEKAAALVEKGKAEESLKSVKKAQEDTERAMTGMRAAQFGETVEKKLQKQRLMTVWQTLARDVARDTFDHPDDERTALLARQAMLFHLQTPDEPRYTVEAALQRVTSMEPFAHILKGHKGDVWSVASASDGTRIASVGRDDIVRLWDREHPLATPREFTGSKDSHSVAISSNGQKLAAGSEDGVVQVWDLSGAQPTQVFRHNKGVTALAFDADGQRLATGEGLDTIRIWNLRDRAAAPQVLEGPGGFTKAIAFSPDGRHLVAATGEQRISYWDLAQPTSPVLINASNVLSLAFSPTDGLRLASGSFDHSVRVWDLSRTDAPPAVLRADDSVNSVAFSPDGLRLAAASSDRLIRIWQANALDREPVVLKGHQGPVYSITFTAAGQRLISGSADGTVRDWELLEPKRPLLTQEAQVRRPTPWMVSPNARRAAFGDGTTVRVKTIDEPQTAARALVGHAKNVTSVDFIGDQMIASSSSDGTIRVWDLRPNEPLPHILDTNTDALVNVVAASRDGRRLVSGSNDGTLRVWDLPRRAPTSILKQTEPVRTLAVSPDGQRFASNGPDGVAVWDLRRLQSPPQILKDKRPVFEGQRGKFSIAFSPDAHLLAVGTGDGSILIWDLGQTAAPLHTFRMQADMDPSGASVLSVAFAPDQRRVASTDSKGAVYLWDLEQAGVPPIQLTRLGTAPRVTFAPDGNHVVIADDRILVWPLWSAAAESLCGRVSRNLTQEEWKLFVGVDIPYQRPCSNVPNTR